MKLEFDSSSFKANCFDSNVNIVTPYTKDLQIFFSESLLPWLQYSFYLQAQYATLDLKFPQQALYTITTAVLVLLWIRPNVQLKVYAGMIHFI